MEIQVIIAEYERMLVIIVNPQGWQFKNENNLSMTDRWLIKGYAK